MPDQLDSVCELLSLFYKVVTTMMMM